MVQISLGQLVALLLSSWFTQQHGAVGFAAPRAVITRQHNNHLVSLRFAPDEAIENDEEDNKEDDDVEFMATFVVNRLGRLLLQKRMKQIQELKDKKAKEEAEEEETQSAFEEVSKLSEPADSGTEKENADLLAGTEEDDGFVSGESLEIPAPIETVEPQSTVEETSAIEPDTQSTMTIDSITVIPSIPPQISLDFGRELEVAKERIPPIQKPVDAV